jgi:hypothetical protein
MKSSAVLSEYQNTSVGQDGSVARNIFTAIIHPQIILYPSGTFSVTHNSSPFKWRHFEPSLILLCVRWYLRYQLSYRDLEEMMRERGLPIDHTTIFRWVQKSELLTQFVTQHNRYAWEIKDGVVSIYPKDNHRDVVVDELLRVEIGSFSVKPGTSCRSLGDSIANTAEVKKILKANGVTYRRMNLTGFYIAQLGDHFTLNISNTTVKTILNKVIKEGPVAKMWLIQRDDTDQTLFIQMSANLEEAPTSFGKPVRMTN